MFEYSATNTQVFIRIFEIQILRSSNIQMTLQI